MGIISALKGLWRSKAARQREELKRVSEVFGTLEKMQRAGLIQWQERDRRLFIAEPLAVVQLRSREAWDAFMQNVMMWALYKRQSEAWQGVFLRAEGDAIRTARKRKAILTKAEIALVRQEARERVSEGAVAVPKVEGFEVFIVGSEELGVRSEELGVRSEELGVRNEELGVRSSPTPNTKHLTPSIIAVGAYDPDRGQTDMVMWSEVAAQVNKNKD